MEAARGRIAAVQTGSGSEASGNSAWITSTGLGYDWLGGGAHRQKPTANKQNKIALLFALIVWRSDMVRERQHLLFN
jgi:hypothetical protein